jgi:hypothetical protein
VTSGDLRGAGDLGCGLGAEAGLNQADAWGKTLANASESARETKTVLLVFGIAALVVGGSIAGANMPDTTVSGRGDEPGG